MTDKSLAHCMLRNEKASLVSLQALSCARFASLSVFALAAVVVALLFWRWGTLPSGDPIKNDAHQNLEIAYNFAVHGVFAREDEKGELAPTNYREPLPPIVVGIYLKALRLFRGPLDFDDLRGGQGARLVKFSNVFWGILLCLSVFTALRVLTDSSMLSLFGTFIVGWNIDVDTLLTELPAAALLALISFFAMMALRTQLARYYGFAGLSLGALVLTKGAFFYVALGLTGCLVLWSIIRWRRNVPAVAVGLLLFVFGILLVVSPWMLRNHSLSGSLSVTERGGGVLLIRALQDQMNRTEYLGSFYVWAPNSRIRQIIGNTLGFSKDDLKRGGRLQRLNRSGNADFAEEDRAAYSQGLPDRAITYYRRAGAEWEKIFLQQAQQGHPQPGSVADQETQEHAVNIILKHPLRHIAATLPFIWRGAPLIAPLLALFAFVAMLWRRLDLIAYILPSVGFVAFLALATHNLPRYNQPVWPIVIVLAIVLAQSLAVRIWKRFSQAYARARGSECRDQNLRH
jgi:hypothetical protein